MLLDGAAFKRIVTGVDLVDVVQRGILAVICRIILTLRLLVVSDSQILDKINMLSSLDQQEHLFAEKFGALGKQTCLELELLLVKLIRKADSSSLLQPLMQVKWGTWGPKLLFLCSILVRLDNFSEELSEFSE